MTKTQICFLCFSLLSTFSAHSNAQEPVRPNILYIYVDDMGWGSIGPNGQAARRDAGKPSVQTPNIDELAKQGVNFQRGYACHVCSPSRSSQQTGFHQGHTFADRNDPDNAKKAIRSDDITIGDALSKAGYATGYWGKWGYGGSKDHDNPKIQNVQTLPTSHGYQHVLAELHHVRAHTYFQPTLWHAPASAELGGMDLISNSMAAYTDPNRYSQSPAFQNHADYPATGYCDDAYAFAAIDFVRKQAINYRETGQPFFGLVAFQVPHGPFDEISSLPDWDKAYEDDQHFSKLSRQSQQWAAMVTRIDAHIGNLLNALKNPSGDGTNQDSVNRETLVVFQSDNGGPGGKCIGELGANGGLRGVKGQIQEGGIRVPLVIRWPQKINESSALRPGSNLDQVVDVTDLLPTFCELAGASVPLGIDGVSIAPTLSDLPTEQQRKRSFIIHEAGNGQSIIRNEFKLVRAKSKRELYNLKLDPAETRNIAKDYPEMVNELEELLIGERVDEPRGFANTYHSWTGDDGDAIDDADNWSDYVYENSGIVYTTDAGPPRISWTAEIENSSQLPSIAHAHKDASFLAINIHGLASQELALDRGVNLTGRNEVRIGANGSLRLSDSAVSTLRWLDIQKTGRLRGTGRIAGTVYNAGEMQPVSIDKTAAGLKINGDFSQSSGGTTVVGLSDSETPLVQISGQANLDGQLRVAVPDGWQPPRDFRRRVLSAKQVKGRFANTSVDDDDRLAIRYEPTGVWLIAK